MRGSHRRRAPKGGCYCNGRFFKGGRFLPNTGEITRPTPKPAPDLATGDAALVDGLASALVHRALADLAPDPDEGRAIRRAIRGCETPADRLVLRRRERAAMAALRDGAADPIVRQFWDRRIVALNLAAAPA